ncbi:MAG: hypothetical protein R3F62_04805 [Planctomycetota bacterium]
MTFVLAALCACGLVAVAEEGQGAGLDEWITLDEDAAREPPWVQIETGFVGWLECRTRVRADNNGVRGTELRNLEQDQGLPSSGIGPAFRLSVGQALRVGLKGDHLVRSGEFERQDEPITFKGVRLAEPGSYVRSRFELLSLGTFAAWSPIAGADYRLTFYGGLQYFRFELKLTGTPQSAAQPTFRSERVRGELLSPVFGGQFELRPFDALGIYTRIEFMNWSWKEAQLKDAEYFDFRLGGRIYFLDDLLAFGGEYRFMLLSAETSGDDDRRVDGAVGLNGLAFFLEVRF